MILKKKNQRRFFMIQAVAKIDGIYSFIWKCKMQEPSVILW